MLRLPYSIQKALKPLGYKIRDRLRYGDETKNEERSVQKEMDIQPMTLELPFGFGGSTFTLAHDTTFEGGIALPPIAWDTIRQRFVSFRLKLLFKLDAQLKF